MSETALETRPFIGLRYFEERDAHLFYGRDEHVSELMAKVAQNRFVAVMGSSGCGKSSFVRAGLLPELRSGMIPKAGTRWKVVEFKPGGAPLQELSDAIRLELGVERARELVEEGPLGVARAVAEARLVEGTNVLVIADQYEEVFRFQREESSRGRWMQAAEQCHALTRRLLDAAAQAELPIYVLLVMRSDYLGECSQFPDLPERMSESLFLVPRLRRDQLQEAITAPVGGAIEAAVVQRLLGEVGSDPDQLPRLQHLLGRMWDRARGGRLTMDHYTDAGGWEKGLEQHLEEVYTSLSVPQQAVCARVFQQLSELDKGRAVRRRAEIRELIEVCGRDAVDVVGKFRAEGFMTPRENPVDITHECILREWPRLREWLEREDRSARRLRELAEAAKDASWRSGLTPKQEKPVRQLAGLTLQNLSRWRDEAQPTAAWASRYLATADFDTAYDYLNWSEKRDKEQKMRELRRALLFRVLLISFATVLLLSTLVTFYLYRRAQRTARESKARELAAFSTESLGEDPERSILLGMQAVNATLGFWQPVVPSAEDALHQAILSSQVRTTLRGHSGAVEGVAYSPDGKRVATASGDQTVKVWDAESGKELLTLRGHSGTVEGVAFSPDGTRLATASVDNTVKVWDAFSGRVLRTLLGHTGFVWGVAYSPDGKRLATASQDHTAKVWDAFSGRVLRTLLGHAKPVYGVAFSPDSKRVATASVDHTAKVWDAVSGQELFTLLGHTDVVARVAYSPDGKRLATASADHTAKVWDAVSGQELFTLLGHTDPVFGVAFSPDSKRVATASWDKTVKVWDAESGKELLTLRGHTDRIWGVAYSHDGRRLATPSEDHTAKVWDAVSRQELLSLRGHIDSVWGVAYSSDGKRLATASADHTAKVWDAVSGQELFTLLGHTECGHTDRIGGVAFSPDGKRLATASADHTAKVWDAVSGQELFTLLGHTECGHTDPVWGVAYSPDWKHLATASEDHTAKVWDAVSGQELFTAKVWDAVSGQELLSLRGHTDPVWGVAYSPDGKHLATASEDHTAKVWDAVSGQELFTLLGHTDRVWGVAYSPDGKRLATASEDHTAKVWDAVSGQELLTLCSQTECGHIHGVAYSPDGKRLATASWDKTVKVWDAVSGRELLTLRGHTDPVWGVAYSPDGKRLATASEDHTAKVWDAVNGQELLSLRGHTDPVWGVAYSPDGKRVATASVDDTIQVYALDIRELLQLARRRVTRNFTREECQRYFQSETCPPLP